jgi:hypothetical protein
VKKLVLLPLRRAFEQKRKYAFYHEQSNSKWNSISVFLTRTEALHLIGYLEQMVENKSNDHAHLMRRFIKRK